MIANQLSGNIVTPDIAPGCHLSLSIGLHTFSYSILDIKEAVFLSVETRTTDRLHNYEELSHFINAELSATGLGNCNFRSVSVAFFSRVSTLVPAALFEEKFREDLLWFNHPVSEKGTVNFDYLKTLDAYTVYFLPDEIKNRILHFFPKVNFMHYSSALIEHFLIENKNIPGKKLFLHLRPASAEVIVTEGKNLLFFNSFHSESDEDTAYFLLFTCEELGININETGLAVYGNKEPDSSLINLLKKYIPDVHFGSRPANFSYSHSLSSIPGHYCIDLFAQYILK